MLTSCGGLRLLRAVRKSDHGAAISVLCVALCRSARKTSILGVRAPRRTTEQERKTVGGNVLLNSKDLRLFLERRV